MPDQKERVAENTPKELPKKPPGYREFQRLLKQIIKVPPLREHPLRKTKDTSTNL